MIGFFLASLVPIISTLHEYPTNIDYRQFKGSARNYVYNFKEWNVGYAAFNYAPELAGFFALLRRDYQIDTVVETGTCYGFSTQLFSLLFNEVHTIEISEDMYAKAAHFLKHSPNVQQHLGSSGEVLAKILPSLIGKRVLFYLDAHWNEHWPLLSELEEISKTHKDNCIIVIDDFKVPGERIPYDHYGSHECSLEYIKNHLEKIFTSYEMHYLIPKSANSKAKFIALPTLKKDLP